MSLPEVNKRARKSLLGLIKIITENNNAIPDETTFIVLLGGKTIRTISSKDPDARNFQGGQWNLQVGVFEKLLEIPGGLLSKALLYNVFTFGGPVSFHLERDKFLYNSFSEKIIRHLFRAQKSTYN